MDTKTRKEVKKRLQAIGMSTDICKYFIESLVICKKKKIHVLDLNLTKELYPALSKKFKKAPSTIEKVMISELGDIWRDTRKREKVVKNFNYESRPSVKKFIIMLSQI